MTLNSQLIAGLLGKFQDSYSSIRIYLAKVSYSLYMVKTKLITEQQLNTKVQKLKRCLTNSCLYILENFCYRKLRGKGRAQGHTLTV